MAIKLIYKTESPRGEVELSASLDGMDLIDMRKEIRQFFASAASLKTEIYDIERAEREIIDSYKNQNLVKIPISEEQDPIMVVS